MKIYIKLLIAIFLVFTAIGYPKGTPLKTVNLSIKNDFFKTPKKSLKLKSINLIKPVSIPPDSNIDFREFFSNK